MSTITDKKITDGQRNAVWVQHQQDRLTGTPQQNKAVFDEYSELIREHFNEAMDVLDERISTNDSDIEELKEINVSDAAESARESAEIASESAQTTQDMLGRVISISNKIYTKSWDVEQEQDEFVFTAEGYTYNESDTYEVFVNGLKLSESEYTRNEDSVVLGSSISAGNTVEIIVTTNLKGKGIADTELNDDYTLTINYDDGTSMTTESIRGEKGEKGDKGDGVYDDTQVKNDIAVLDSRVDSFTHLTEGSTTGDAELIDARVGADGTIYANAGDAVRGQVDNLQNNKADLPTVGEEAQFTAEIGIINKTNLSVYSEGSTYSGRYASIPVTAGEKYLISGYSVNNNFCGAFGVVSGGTSAFYPPFIDGYGVSFTDLEITIPNTVATLYVNGNVSHPVSIKKISHLEQATFDVQFNKIDAPAMYAYVDSGSNLYFKKKSTTSKKDVCIKMGHSLIGNNLFSFLDMYDKSNTGELSNDFTPESGGSTLSMSQSDWVSPYVVRSVSNPDGDHPSSDYFTGGNHRSNNSSVGGGKTATETSLTILIDGFVPTVGNVYPCSCIDVFTTNLINGYNTSKDDGTGRNIISENIHFHITAEKVEVKRTIIPLESVVINRCYGLQVYCPNATVSLVGGENRVPFAINTNQNSGNKNTRDVIVSGDFEIRSGIYPIDIGSFNYNNADFSYFSSGNKVYSNVIFNNTLEFSANEKYYCNGYYTFN